MRRQLVVVALALFAAFSCGPPQEPIAPAPPPVPKQAEVTSTAPRPGLDFALSQGAEHVAMRPRPPLAPAQVLPAADASKVLARMPPLAAEADDPKPFALRERSLPPPRTGRTVAAPFPPAAGLQAAAGGPAASTVLEVLRRAPEGEVPLAPHLAVTFSQPMVPVTSQDEALTRVPVKLTPEPPGQWRWVGTSTLLFAPEGRFPMATEYSVEIPAGTRSATGGELVSAVCWKFGTPAPKVVQSVPRGGPTRLDPIVFLEFDQAVDPRAVVSSVSVRAGDNPAVPVAPVDRGELDKDDELRRLAAGSQPGRFVAFRPMADLPADTRVQVRVGPGTPSLEGPRRTTTAHEIGFRTFGPLRVVKERCGWGECRPGTPFQFEFSNPVDAKRLRKELVRVEPALPDLKLEAWGSHLAVRGATRGGRYYRVTLSSAITDTFGQTMRKDRTHGFLVSPAYPRLFAPRSGFVVLDPAGRRRFSVYTVNHDRLRVRLYAVTPEDYFAWVAYLADGKRFEAGREPPGRRVVDTTLKVKGPVEELLETAVDLAPALRRGLGHAVLVVEQADGPKDRWRRQVVEAWVQSSRIGLDAFADPTRLVVWATALVDGAPLRGVDLRVLPAGTAAATGGDGLATVALEDQPGRLLVARQGADAAILPQTLYYWGGEDGWRRRRLEDLVRFHTFDDRRLYRPGEEVRVKGWVRRIGAGPSGDLGPVEGGSRKVEWTLRDSRQSRVTAGAAHLGPLGGFDVAVKLPPTMNLGHASLDLVLDGRRSSHSFQVQEFRRPEFEVKAQASEGPHLVGGGADVTVSAAYFAGGGLMGAPVRWSVTAEPGHFSPPGRDAFTFGVWTPWWDSPRWDDEAERPATRSESLGGRTDAAGKHRLRIDFRAVSPPRAQSLRAEATVTDVNRQAWTATSLLLVHPASLYVGIRSERAFYEAGQPIPVEAIVTDLDGQAVAGRSVALRAVRLEWEQEAGEWREKLVDPQDASLESGPAPGQVKFQPRRGGVYRVTAVVADAQGRKNESRLTVWVAGAQLPPARGVEQEKVSLIPDRKDYRPGDVAEILVLAPFAPAAGTLTLRRSGLASVERFSMPGSSTTLRVPIRDGHTPNLHVQVDLVGAAPRAGQDGQPDPKLPKRPAFAAGALNLSVPPRSRLLAVTVKPEQTRLEPGGRTSVSLTVRDAAGRPVAGGEVALVVADEAVLALTGYRIGDPAAAFYSGREPGVADHHGRAHVVLARKPRDLDSGRDRDHDGIADAKDSEPESVNGNGFQDVDGRPEKPREARAIRFEHRGPPGAKGEGGQAAPIRMRTDFSPLALFAASVTTDAAGRATVPVKLPDNLTRYRVTAVAVAGSRHFGVAESSITARLPLMVRTSPPRFLNFGDRFELPVVLQNQTDAPLTVDVAARATNATLTGGAGRRLTVPANDRVEVRFPAAAARAGVARFQVGAMAGAWADASSFSLPVWTPATTAAFATYGHLDRGAVAQPVRAPKDVVADFGGLEVTTSSTALQALTDAVLYLVAYPFECAEQIASRVMAVAALRDVLQAFKAKGLPEPKEMIAQVAADLQRLRGLQAADGGFGFWRRDEESWPYLSIHVAHALQRAKEKGFAVPADLLRRAQAYLRQVERRIPRWYGEDARRTLVAYALHVRHRLGDRDGGRARRLLQEGGLQALPLEALGWLLPVLAPDKASAAEVADIRRHLRNRVTETAATAHFATSYRDGAHLLLHSDRRADAVLLEALITVEPRSDLIPKLVAGLLAHRTAGRWENTQENAFVLLALDRYFGAYEKATPDFMARAWLGPTYAGGHGFRGRTTERHHVGVPMAALLSAGPRDLIIAKEGPGRLYYRVGLQYAPRDLLLPPVDRGFTVTRAYEAIDAPGDVRRGADGSWRIKAGARVRVRLTMVAPTRRYHVALTDPLPAGLEPQNPALATTGTLPKDPQDPQARRGFWWWWGPWYQHQNLRDERAEAFTTLLWDGVHAYSYVARATTPGTFVVPPPKAEEMYHPETFGRGRGDRVVVE
ncbi:MAG: Ig-like domain-containing protein [Deltaproteobacteria bacterium]|nr:Ig-like domain-containing protein [Deltaproteobacteria bacterium]